MRDTSQVDAVDGEVVGVWMEGRGQIKEVRNSAGEGEREGPR